MRKLIGEEELNLQDLIFILLFFFIIAQTLIVFKVQKDLIVPPKVDRDPELVINEEDPDIITLIIDERSTVAALAGNERREVLRGFDAEEFDVPIEYYFDPARNQELFLDTEEADAYQTIVDAVREIARQYGYEKPHIGLIADHRARYGAIFQVNVAVQELIQAEDVDPTVKWKVFVDRSNSVYDEFPDAEPVEPEPDAEAEGEG